MTTTRRPHPFDLAEEYKLLGLGKGVAEMARRGRRHGRKHGRK